jgi:hypothetical protein
MISAGKEQLLHLHGLALPACDWLIGLSNGGSNGGKEMFEVRGSGSMQQSAGLWTDNEHRVHPTLNAKG